MANIKLDCASCKSINPATKILNALCVSVPEHSSSPNIMLYSSAFFNIIRSSLISTPNVESPLYKLSTPRIRVKNARYGLYTNSVHGTKNPVCARIAAMPMARIRLVFPTALVPYNNMPPPSKVTSFATYNSFCWICSMRTWRRPFAFI